jgi:hypothetical protein
LPSAPDPPIELHKLQFDYAWKWFSFHADQRVKMFNYMLVVFGIFAAGIVNALDKHLPKAAVSSLCFIAAALAIVFLLLDIRNRYLVWLGEDVLMDLERRGIFGTDIRISGRYGAEVDLGILSRQALEERRATDKIRTRLGPDLFVPVVIGMRDAWGRSCRIQVEAPQGVRDAQRRLRSFSRARPLLRRCHGGSLEVRRR